MKRKRTKQEPFRLTSEEMTALTQWRWHEKDNYVVSSLVGKIERFMAAGKRGRKKEPTT